MPRPRLRMIGPLISGLVANVILYGFCKHDICFVTFLKLPQFCTAANACFYLCFKLMTWAIDDW